MKKNNYKLILNSLIVISILSMIISIYLIYLHYADTSSFCDISPSLSCDIVNKSRYSEFPPGNGIPVSIFGFLTFSALLVLFMFIKEGFSYKINKTKIDKKFLVKIIIWILWVSVLFSAYLVYAELFLILSICILCVVLDILIIIMLILTYKLKKVVK